MAISGALIELRLPFTLSPEARRAVMIASGLDPEEVQYWEVGDIAVIEDDQLRARIIDLRDQIEVATDGERPQFRRFGPLRWLGGWQLRFDHVMHPAHEFVQASPGTTRPVLFLAAGEEASAFWRSVWTAPEVGSLNEHETVDLGLVLDAYERVIEVVDRAVELAREARRQSGGLVMVSDDREHITIAPPETEEEQERIDLVRESDPGAFDEAIAVIDQISDLSEEVVRAFANEATSAAFHQLDPDADPTDASIVTGALMPAARKALERIAEDTGRADADAEYAAERAGWIAANGSERLKLAAARGYKHDAVYRDERLAQELPEFVGVLPRESQVREAINPSAEALEAESEVLEEVESGRFGNVDVRIIWLQTFETPPGPGEYLQIKGYLGRHDVYRRISPEEGVLPF
jgi:hypothetical protein